MVLFFKKFFFPLFLCLFLLSFEKVDSLSVYLKKFENANFRELQTIAKQENTTKKVAANYYLAKKLYYNQNFSEAYTIFKNIEEFNSFFNDEFAYKLNVNVALTCVELNKFDEAANYFKLAENYILTTKNEPEKALLWFDLGIFYKKQEDYAISAKYFQKSVLIFQKNKSYLNLTAAYLELGTISQAINLYKIALDYFQKAKKLSSKHNFIQDNINSFINIGVAQTALNNFEEAAMYLNEALKKAEKENYLLGKIYSLNGIAALFIAKNDNKNAIKFLTQTEALLKEAKDENLKNLIINNLGVTYSRLNQFDKALYYFNSLLENAKAGNDLHFQKKLHLSIAEVYKLQKKYDLSQKEIENAQKIEFSDFNLDFQIHFLNADLSIFKGQFQKALNSLHLLETNTQIESNLKAKQGVFLRLSEVYSFMGQEGLALKYYKKYEKIKEEINSKIYSFQLAKIENDSKLRELAQKLQKQKLLMALKENKLKSQKKGIIFLSLSGVVFLVLSIALFFMYRAIKQTNKDLLQRNIELAKQVPFQQEKQQLHTSSEFDDKDKQLIERLLNVFAEEKLYLQNELSLSKLAQHLDTNRTYLSAAIQQVMNTNYTDLINKYRIEEARKMLINPAQNLSIEGIAYEVGFNSKSAFHAAFKKYTGVTPSALRRETLLENEPL